MKYWQKPFWRRDIPNRRLCFYPGGMGEEGALIDDDLFTCIPFDAYEHLKQWMKENDPYGVIRTDRVEDLKIIHRLLDLMEAAGR